MSDGCCRFTDIRSSPPILVQTSRTPGGMAGQAINSMLRHYAAMRACDGFTAPSDYVREFYAEFVWDPSFFNTLPNGVDATLFKPMEKMVAKREIAEAVGDDRIERVPTVGYLSRVQSEKGASVYVKAFSGTEPASDVSDCGTESRKVCLAETPGEPRLCGLPSARKATDRLQCVRYLLFSVDVG